MPPKRKRTTAEGTNEAQGGPSGTTRATRSSSRVAGSAAQGSTSGTPNVVATSSKDSPPAKKTRKATTSKATKTTKGKTRVKAIPDARSEDDESSQKRPDDHEATATSSVHTNGSATSKHAPVPAKKPPPTKPKKSVERIHQFDPYSPPQAASLFATYADQDDPGVIGPEGFEKLCNTTNISLEGALPLVMAWQMSASEMAKIKKEEWEKSTAALKISSLGTISMVVHDLEDLLLLDKPAVKAPSAPPGGSRGSTSSLQLEPYDRSRYYEYAKDTRKAFGELYTFCFMLAKPPQGRNIDMETACAFWTVLLVPRYPILSEVIEFINEKGTYKGVNKDLWSMMLEFCRTVSPTLEDYEADGAWPTLLDDFVVWKKSKTSS